LAVVAEAEALVVVLQVVVLEAVASVEDLEVEDSLAADLVEAGKIFKYKPLHLEKRVLNITTKKSRLASRFFNYYFSKYQLEHLRSPSCL
jgi:hypothetical protein